MQKHSGERKWFRRAGRGEPVVVVAHSMGGPVGIAAEPLTVTRERFGSVPHGYILCAKDRAVPIALQRRFVREMDQVSAAPTKVAELDSAHSPFLSVPDALVDAIVEMSSTR